MTYIAHISTNFWCSRRIITTAHQAHKSFLKPSQLGSTQLNCCHCGARHRYPFTPGWREAIMVKCLAQGHKHHGCGRDSNPHSDDSAIRTQTRCTKPLSHGTPCRVGKWDEIILWISLKLFPVEKIQCTLTHRILHHHLGASRSECCVWPRIKLK